MIASALFRQRPSFVRRTAVGLGALALAGLTAGCISAAHYTTDTPRSATEQLLVTTAAERAVDRLAWPDVRDRRVAVEVVSPNEKDAGYLKAALEAKARELGGKVVPAEEAEWILAARAGTLGTERRDLALGIPEIPTPFGITPGISFYEHRRQRGWAQVRLAARDADGEMIAAGDTPVLTGAFRSSHRILVLVIDRDDIFLPEEGGGDE